MAEENKLKEQNLQQQLIEAFRDVPIVKITNAKELNKTYEDDDD